MANDYTFNDFLNEENKIDRFRWLESRYAKLHLQLHPNHKILVHIPSVEEELDAVRNQMNRMYFSYYWECLIKDYKPIPYSGEIYLEIPP